MRGSLLLTASPARSPSRWARLALLLALALGAALNAPAQSASPLSDPVTGPFAPLAGAGSDPFTPAGEPELLAPGQAFRFDLVSRARALRLEADVAEGYYLYRDRISVEPRTPGLVLDAALLPPGERQDDPLFGVVEVYRGRAVIELPVSAVPEGADGLEVAVTSQGCADLGVCYPPETRVLRAALPAAVAAPEPGSPGGALARLERVFGAQSAAQEEFLPVDEAFRVRAQAGAGDAVEVAFDIAPGYYLYRSRMGFEAVAPPGAGVAGVRLPEGEPKVDEWLGEQQVFHDAVSARLALRGAPASAPVRLRVAYQGCADAGLCYPPQERLLTVSFGGAAGAAPLAPSAGVSPIGAPAASAGVSPIGAPAASAGATLSETDRLAASLARDALGLVLASFFVAGLLLAFTPCVLPMVPILSAIIAGQQGPPSGRRGLALSAVYVLAMSLAYTAAGVAAGLFGQNLQAMFQHPAVLLGFSALFVALALAMFGLYELQLPVALQSRLAALSHRQRGGSYAGVAVMGVLSALIVGPCVAAPLAAALIVIGSTGDPLRGGLALFALSMGMGVPLLAVGAFGTALLPRAGNWMALVRNAFGLMLLAVAVYLLGRLLPGAVTLALWAALALLTAAVLVLSGRAGRIRPGALRLGGATAAVAYAALLAVGSATGASDPLRPLDGIGRTGHTALAFQRVKTVDEVERIVTGASREGRGVMLDFYADWCVSCKEMERDTFTSPQVRAALAGAVLLQADVTDYDAEDQALLARYGLFGPPAILFFGPDGRERRVHRVIGYMDAASFAPHVARARRS